MSLGLDIGKICIGAAGGILAPYTGGASVVAATLVVGGIQCGEGVQKKNLQEKADLAKQNSELKAQWLQEAGMRASYANGARRPRVGENDKESHTPVRISTGTGTVSGGTPSSTSTGGRSNPLGR